MTTALTPLRGSRVRWTTILGLLLVPLTVAGVFLWGLWNPVERLGTVTAAVVNLDEPVEMDGQLVPLGRVLAAELIAGSSDGSASDPDRVNFTWVLTDEADASDGLEDGRYATSITIPQDFSAAATSLADGPETARAATIYIAESERGRLLDTALSSIVTQTATGVLNQQLGEQFVGNVLIGMTTLSDGIAGAADGANQLADGGNQLAEGTRALADGTNQLADGTGQLASGASALVGGATELSSGTAELAGGASALAEGAAGLAGGAAGLAAGAQEAADGGQELAGGVAAYVDNINAIASGLQGGLGMVASPLEQLRDLIVSDTIPLPEGVSKDEMLTMLNQAIEQVNLLASDNPQSPLFQLQEGGSALAAGVAQSAAGQQELATGLQAYAGGVSQFSAGVNDLANGAGALSGGAAEFSSGLATFSGGVSELAAQTPELAAGANELADGAAAAAEGVETLAGGLDEAVAGIPTYTEDESQVMAQTAVESVRAEGESGELFNSSGVPLFAGIALWAGALATFLVLSPLWARTREAARGVFALTARSIAPAVLLGGAQGAIAGAILPIALGYDFGAGAAFFGLALLAGVAFGLLVQGLSARFGGFGRFVAFALLVIAFTVGIVSTVPGPLAAVGDASPLGAAFTGFQAIASGVAGAGGAALLLALWSFAGIALTAWAVVRKRRQV